MRRNHQHRSGGKALVASMRNLALRDASYCNYCNQLVPDDPIFQEAHLKEVHGINRQGEGTENT
jgi:hypothetical protein